MLQHIGEAEREVYNTLDYVSLLLSKQLPQQASSTITPTRRQDIPLGSFGVDIWQRMPADKPREAQDQLVATNVRIQGLQQSADSILAAASRLEDNVRKETQYWDHVLAVSESWSVARAPGQNRLAVRFGMNESSPEFAGRGIAALNADSDGNISLDRGLGIKPRALRVVIRRDGVEVGASRLPKTLDDSETGLETRIRQARDGLFDEELYHEMIRESRTILSLGLRLNGSAIRFTPQDQHDVITDIAFELMGLDDDVTTVELEHDAYAEAFALAARLLLSEAQRARLKKRSDIPPPLSEKRQTRGILPILRPIMSFLLHNLAVQSLTTYTQRIERLLAAAQVDASILHPKLSFASTTESAGAQSLVNDLMQPWSSVATFDLPGHGDDAHKLSISILTTLSNSFGPVYTLKSTVHSHRFTTFPEIATAIDRALESALVSTLHNEAGMDWKCRPREALLTKPAGLDGRGESVRVSIDGQGGTLVLTTSARETTWSVDGVSSVTSLVDAWKDVMHCFTP